VKIWKKYARERTSAEYKNQRKKYTASNSEKNAIKQCPHTYAKMKVMKNAEASLPRGGGKSQFLIDRGGRKGKVYGRRILTGEQKRGWILSKTNRG